MATSAKKAKAGLRSFDELKTIEMPDSEKDDGGGAGAGLGAEANGILQGALDSILEKYQTAWDKAFSEMEDRANTFADNVARAFKEKGLYGVGEYFSESLTKVLNNIPWNSMYEGARNFGTGLAQFLNGLISPELFSAVGKTIAGSLNTVLHFLDSFGKEFDFTNFGVSIGAGINAALEGIDWKTALSAAKNWGTGIGNAINGFLQETDFSLVGSTIANALNTVIQFFLNLGVTLDFEQIGTSISDAINGFFETFSFSDLAETLNVWAKGILDALITALEKTNWKNIGKKIGEFISGIDFMEITWKLAKLAESLVSGIVDAIIGFIETAPLELAIIGLFGFIKIYGTRRNDCKKRRDRFDAARNHPS